MQFDDIVLRIGKPDIQCEKRFAVPITGKGYSFLHTVVLDRTDVTHGHAPAEKTGGQRIGCSGRNRNIRIAHDKRCSGRCASELQGERRIG